MTSVAQRIIASPGRSETTAWEVIISLLEPQMESAARKDLLAVNSIACSLIADEAIGRRQLSSMVRDHGSGCAASLAKTLSLAMTPNCAKL